MTLYQVEVLPNRVYNLPCEHTDNVGIQLQQSYFEATVLVHTSLRAW